VNKNIKSQSLTELSMVFLVVAAALFSMQVYMKRGIQAGVAATADLLGPQQKAVPSSIRVTSSTNSTSGQSAWGSPSQQKAGRSITYVYDQSSITSGVSNSTTTTYFSDGY
jgi:hypothetical protein